VALLAHARVRARQEENGGGGVQAHAARVAGVAGTAAVERAARCGVLVVAVTRECGAAQVAIDTRRRRVELAVTTTVVAAGTASAYGEYHSNARTHATTRSTKRKHDGNH